MSLGFCDITIELLKENKCDLASYTAEDVLEISKMVKSLYSFNICSKKKMCELVEGALIRSRYSKCNNSTGISICVTKVRYNKSDDTILVDINDGIRLYSRSEFRSPLEVLFEIIKRLEFELNRRSV